MGTSVKKAVVQDTHRSKAIVEDECTHTPTRTLARTHVRAHTRAHSIDQMRHDTERIG